MNLDQQVGLSAPPRPAPRERLHHLLLGLTGDVACATAGNGSNLSAPKPRATVSFAFAA